jgi:hypothetical protein
MNEAPSVVSHLARSILEKFEKSVFVKRPTRILKPCGSVKMHDLYFSKSTSLKFKTFGI